MPYNTPHLSLQDCYTILSVSKSVTAEELKRVYHKKALELHPDRNPDDPDATKNFQRLNEAYNELSRYLRGEKSFVASESSHFENTENWHEKWQAYTHWNFSDFTDFDDSYDEDESDDKEYEDADREAYAVDDEDDSANTNEETLKDLLSNPNAQRINIFYTSKVKNLYPNENGEILYQLRFDSIYQSKISGNRLLGHSIIEILIRKLVKADKAPSVLWLTTILFIAKDPRESTKSESYRTWWRLMKPGYTNNVKRWLADYDIEAFIKIMGIVLSTARVDDPEQALKTREALIRGLFDHKYVREVRLFVGGPIAKYIKELYPEPLTPFFTEMKGAGNFAAIYMNLRDKVHLIEGTHNTAVRILSKIPKKSVLAPDYDRTKKISKTDLGRKLMTAYMEEFHDHLVFEKQHSFSWKREVKNIFELLGLDIKKSFICYGDEIYY